MIPYVFVAPREPDEVGALAARVFNERYRGLNGLRRFNPALLGRIVAGGDDPLHGELLSVLLFDPEFLGELVSLGRREAQRWVDEHPGDIWQTGPLTA